MGRGELRRGHHAYKPRQARQKPDWFLDLAEELLRCPCTDHAQAFHDRLAPYRDWGVTRQEAVNRFMADTE